MADISQVIQQAGSAVSAYGAAAGELLGAQGSMASASSYETAATIAEQNAQIVEQGTEIQKVQQQRQIYQTIGAQEAGVGGAGMAESGSALDLLRSSTTQGELSRATLTQQGIITENSYKSQATQYRGMAAAARAAAAAQEKSSSMSKLGAEIGTVATIAALL